MYPSLDARLAQRNELIEQGSRSENWSLLGPIETFIADSTRSPRQNNVRGFAQSTSHPDILYAGKRNQAKSISRLIVANTGKSQLT